MAHRRLEITNISTHRSYGESKVAASERLLRNAFEHAAAGMAVIDPQGKFFEINESFCRITGRTAEDLFSRDLYEITHPDDRERSRLEMQRLLAQEVESIVIEKRYETSTRATVWVRNSVSVLCGEDGVPEVVVAICEDVTERRNAEQLLLESEQRNRAILRSTRDCIKVLDLGGNVLSINPEGQERLGITDFEQVRGRCWTEFWDGNDRQCAEKAIEKAKNGGEGSFEGFFVNFRGEPTWWDVCVTSMRNDEGKITHLLSVSREISERKKAEEALRKTEKLAAMGQMASSIAHEINNPLTAITGLVYLAESAPEVSDQTKGYLNRAQAELQRVAQITTQTLKFHRPTAQHTPTDLAEVFASVMSLHQGRARSQNIEVRERHRLSTVTCNSSEIRQVLANLVGNALDAMPKGGRLHLRTRGGKHRKRGHRGVYITVADSGEGMSKETRTHMFDAFFTTKGASGTGLGLWVSASILKKHGATVRVRSSRRAGRSGTVFSIFVPD